MSEGYPIAAQKEALRLICEHGPLDTHQLGERLVTARGLSSDPGYAPAIARMAGTLTWRLQAQGFIAEGHAGDLWTTTPDGRELISCTGERR
ncbi:hypothetical protein [Nonomuraea roseola]|uniref:Restriction system protein Mrr-like N-terminal domain-containing protein n=1 Tax=Nonomuraea roseola TaxID=46179 RepID=A0ABV5PTT5_9ACTN